MDWEFLEDLKDLFLACHEAAGFDDVDAYRVYSGGFGCNLFVRLD